MMELEPSPAEKDHRLGQVHNKVREHGRKRLRERLRVRHGCKDRLCSLVTSAAARQIHGLLARGLRHHRMVVGCVSGIIDPMGVLMAIVVIFMDLGVSVRAVRGTRESAHGQHPAGG